MGIGILGWIVLGLVVGTVAKWIMEMLPGRNPHGFIVTILLGIAGALLGGFLARSLFHMQVSGFFHLRTWVVALIGSIILLGIYHIFFGSKERV